MSQHNIILEAMLTNRNKKFWTAKDFQHDPYFVGYEASARMSELANKYEDLLIVGRDGRFRTLSVNWNCEDIDDILDSIE